jgi:hypothetical protein
MIPSIRELLQKPNQNFGWNTLPEGIADPEGVLNL